MTDCAIGICSAASIETWCLFRKDYVTHSSRVLLTSFTYVERFGGRGDSSRTAGCCGSCCKKSFDEDQFEDELEAAKKQREGQNQGAVETQPTKKEDMKSPSPRASAEHSTTQTKGAAEGGA